MTRNYDSRIVKLTVDEAGATAAEEELEKATAADASGEEVEDQIRIPLEALVGAPSLFRGRKRRRSSSIWPSSSASQR